MILMLRTDNPQAELYLYHNGKITNQMLWQAHRQLADTIHIRIDELLRAANISFNDLTGLAVYKGPGSFTGLRIGISVANGFAYALDLPIVATMGDNWQQQALLNIANGQNDKIITPHYGAEAHITKPKK